MFYRDQPSLASGVNHAFAATVSNRSRGHFSVASPALTAGVVLIVMWRRHQLYQAKYNPSIASWLRFFLLNAFVSLVYLRSVMIGPRWLLKQPPGFCFYSSCVDVPRYVHGQRGKVARVRQKRRQGVTIPSARCGPLRQGIRLLRHQDAGRSP